MPGPRNKGVPEKSKNFGAAMKRLIKELKKYRVKIIVSATMAIIGTAIDIAGPNLLSDLTDAIATGLRNSVDFSIVWKFVLIIFSLYILGTIFEIIESFLMTDVANGFAQDLRTRISEKINRLPLKFFDKNEIGDTLSRVTNDVDTLASSLSDSLATIVVNILMLIGVVVMMFVTSVPLAITAIISGIAGLVFVALILSRSQKYFTMRQKELGKINSHIEEIYSGINVVRVYNAKEEASKKFDYLNKRVYEVNRKSQFLSGLMPPMMHFIGNLGYVAVCVVGAILVTNNAITFGVIVAFIVYVRMFTRPLTQIAQSLNLLQSSAAAAERVFEFLDEKEMPKENALMHLDKNKVKGEIEFKNVQFGYTENKIIIKDFSAKAMPGQKIAIVGPTGAGKTTMVNLLMKFYDVNSGDILIDGVSIHDLSRENVHEMFTMVLQDTWLFSDSLKNNIIYNHANISDAEVDKVCETVGLTHFIKTLPEGISSNISDDNSVSAGQRQLITIARGMIKDAPFLILDEATSNVDTRTEELVQKAMDKLMKGRTSFIIAHRLSTIKNADLILVMKDGDIIESGTHDELLEKDGFYAELYNSQFLTS
ncbi:ABC transporter ATP-binding protein [Candidatus Saccharibacteria bacterium]|nr:ABC transporter ATP-binding protein [Candidatus Saccharibacteria bacterium]